MDRQHFEHLRDLPNKSINGDITLQATREGHPVLTTKVKIENSAGLEAWLKISFNAETDAKTLNVWVPGLGPICRLDIDGPAHKPYGRCHKHSLQFPDCCLPSINLSKNIIDRSELSGKSIEEVFMDFCVKSNIQHNGLFASP